MNHSPAQFARFVVALATIITSVTITRSDEVTDWNAYWEESVFATAQPAPAHARFAAILHVAIFDAVNGIEHKYTPYYVTDQAPPGAREEAAAAQAAYTVLSALYPATQSSLDAHLAASIAALPGGNGKSQSIARGRDWGQYVANKILALRANDGWSTPPAPFLGGFDVGEWRSIAVPGSADGTLPAVFTQNAILHPFAMTSPSQFRPGPPYGAPTIAQALATPEYAADLNEVKEIGRNTSATRTHDQTQLALLWQNAGPVDLNRIARSVTPECHSLVENARMFALLNMATCDALIASMDSKFVYSLWRPYHAIRFADFDGNPATDADPNWTALFVAPRFPEYISNHSSLTGAFMHTLARLVGNEHTFTLSSPNFPNFTWTFTSCSEAADQVKEARIWAGIHYRNSCEVGQQVGQEVAEYVLQNFLRPEHCHSHSHSR